MNGADEQEQTYTFIFSWVNVADIMSFFSSKLVHFHERNFLDKFICKERKRGRGVNGECEREEDKNFLHFI